MNSTIQYLLIMTTCSTLISCSENKTNHTELEPVATLLEQKQEAISNANSDFNVGDKMDFMRLANGARLANFTIQKVDGSNILITLDDTPKTSPYWVNAGSAISFRHSELVINHASEKSEDTDTTIAITSTKQIATFIEQIKPSLPSGKKWNELGILEKRNWVRALDRRIPDFYYPASIKVSNISDSWQDDYRVSGEINAIDTGVVSAKIHPALAELDIKINSAQIPNPHFSYDGYNTFKDVRSGDTLKYEFRIRVSISLNSDESDILLNVWQMNDTRNLKK